MTTEYAVIALLIALLIVVVKIALNQRGTILNQRDMLQMYNDQYNTDVNYYYDLMLYWHNKAMSYSKAIDKRYDATLKTTKPIHLERTVKENGVTRIVEDTALVMAGMGVNGKTRPTQDKYGNIYFLLPNQTITYVPDDSYGQYGKPEVITIETPASQPATKGNDQNKAKDNKPTDQNKKQNNAVNTDSPAIVLDVSATVISQVVSKSGKGKLSTKESETANKLIDGWQKKSMEESRMVEILCNMRKNGSLAK